ncbi:MAG TPA: hypothetical protein PK478_00635 [Nitrospira sp.]|jgi:uncharacterized protein YegP (UPF0339 family)|nr:hypothetical protein [Nitrospira sp.]
MSDTTPEIIFDAGAIYDYEVAEGNPDPLKSVIFQAVGLASTCWDNLIGAGTFDDQLAKQIGEDLTAFLREQGVPRNATKNDYAEVYTDAAGEWRYAVFAGNHRQFDKSEEGLACKSNALRALKRKHPHIEYITERTQA